MLHQVTSDDITFVYANCVIVIGPEHPIFYNNCSFRGVKRETSYNVYNIEIKSVKQFVSTFIGKSCNYFPSSTYLYMKIENNSDLSKKDPVIVTGDLVVVYKDL